MCSDTYFSDRESGLPPRVLEEITSDVYGGLVSLIGTLIDNGSFGIDFPDKCPDGRGVSGTDSRSMALALRAEIPALDWPLDLHDLTWQVDQNETPPTLVILDLIEFCHRTVAKPIQGAHHSFFGHWHLDFDREEGQKDFRQRIERIFARNGLAYELKKNGQIFRLAPPFLRESLHSTLFRTEDPHLNEMLEIARRKYLDSDPLVRRESLEKLWDAWERLKTIKNPKDKKKSIGMLLDSASPEVNFRERLDSEAKELTEIGNRFMIRHTETTKIPITSSNQVDYLFHRLFALIHFLLKSI